MENKNILKDIFIIILIVMSSFIFTLDDKGKVFNPQMMFILLVLVIIVIHKLILVSQKKKRLDTKEHFTEQTDLAAQINQFIDRQSSDQVVKQIPAMSNEQQRQYLQSIQNLSNQVTSLNQRLNDVNQNSNSIVGSGQPGTTNDRLSLETIQKMQNFQIDYLQKQIEKSKELLQQQEIEESIKKYRPIKVYSSCAVSSADGAFSNDAVSNNLQQPVSNMSNDQLKALNDMYRTVGQGTNTDNHNILGDKISGFLNSLSGPTSIEIN